MYYLGIDTSNYTTSAAIYDSENNLVIHRKKLLPVKQGECGLRQSDAVFHHVQQLPQVINDLFNEFHGNITAVGVSAKPRDVKGSYMPCFTVGHGTAKILSQVLNVPLYEFSHQNGHIAAALYSSKKTELVGQKFLAFHVSGGTTESVIVQPHEENIFQVELVGKTLDLNAGQLIDRIGVMLGLKFPCGHELEQLALKSNAKIKAKATLKDTDCCLSGIENICKKAFSDGMSKEDVSLMCLMYVEKAISEMCKKILEKYGEMPVIFAGGVMSDKIIKDKISEKFNAYFATPEFSADNAGGTAFLTYLKHKNMGAGILIPAEVKGEQPLWGLGQRPNNQ